MADKSEPRFNVDLPIRVFGVDADDRVFSQVAHARNISEHGAKLVGLEEHLNPGDIIGVHFGDKKARCNVIWVVDARETQKIDVGVKVKGSRIPGKRKWRPSKPLEPCLFPESHQPRRTRENFPASGFFFRSKSVVAKAMRR